MKHAARRRPAHLLALVLNCLACAAAGAQEASPTNSVLPDPLSEFVEALPSEAPVVEPPAPIVERPRRSMVEDADRTDLWVRLRLGFALPDLDGDTVRKWEQWYAARPDYVQRMTERGGRYLFHILEEVQRREMPTEIALLPFIESAFNPQALSVASAAGMWQFMPLTGRDFDLRQNLFRDDRRDVLASTRAALDYLQRLHEMFGDWHLALAAYNWGQGNVQKAVQRNQRAGLATDFDSLRMPDETRNYVPKLQAVKNILLRPTDFALVLPALLNHPFFLSVPIERDIDVAVAARLAGLSVEEFQQLNPQMNKPVILAAGTPQVLLPYDNANAFLRAINGHRGPLATWTAWTLPKTLKPAEAARQAGMSEAQLRAINRIPERMVVKSGSTLLVPRSAQAQNDVAEHVADNAMLALAPDVPPLRRVAFAAGKRGETVVAVARRYRLAPAAVAQWNDVATGAAFKPGQTIVVMLPALKARAVVQATARPAPAAVRPVAAAATHGAVAPRAAAARAPVATHTAAASARKQPPGRPLRVASR